MNKILIYLLAMIVVFFFGLVSNYVQDIFDGFFEKEQFWFFVQVNFILVFGEVEMVFYFMYSKVSEVEVFVWFIDFGGNLQDL